MTPIASITVPPSAQAAVSHLTHRVTGPDETVTAQGESITAISTKPYDGQYLMPRLANQPRVTRLKMTLHSAVELQSSGHDPLTRCTFGAVYSPNPSEEDHVYGNATPYGALSYNVRSELAADLVVGQAYYVDIHPVPV